MKFNCIISFLFLKISQARKYTESRLFQQGLDEILINDSDIESDVQFSVKLPKIPKEFAHIIEDFDIDEVENQYRTPNQVCDCFEDQDQLLSDCPHFSDPSFAALYSQIPQRLALLEHADTEAKKEIRMNLFKNIIKTLEKLPCPSVQENYQQETIDTDVQSEDLRRLPQYQPKVLTNQLQQKEIGLPKKLCHIYRDLQQWFPEEFEEYFKQPDQKQQELEKQHLLNSHQNNKCYQFLHPTRPNLAINLSFASNIILLILKIVAFAVSNSMSILASMVDSATDILCGLVMFLAVQLAKRGIQKGQYQQYLHSRNQQIKIMYARRYENLGQLSFSWIMTCLSVMLIAEAAKQIADYAGGEEEEVDFTALPMSIIIFTILLKLFLCIFCYDTTKKYLDQRDVVKSYAQDHRNDVLSNTIGFTGAALTYYLKGNWKYADPVASIILCIYIFYNWLSNALEAMKQLAGSRVEQEVVDDLLLRLFQFSSTIYIIAIDQVLAYYSGTSIIVEMRLTFPDKLSLPASHQIVQEIQSEYERLPLVERCYVHVECDGAVNIL